MNKRLRKMQREIERRGGVVHLGDLPDDVAELFLREVLDCPECLAEARRARSLDGEGSQRDH
jgi:hypothetical protein